MRFLNFYTIFSLFITVIVCVCPEGLLAEDGNKGTNRIEITIKENSMVQLNHIFLGDIADIRAHGFLKEAIEKIDLGPSPKPDKIKSIDKRKILSAVQGRQFLPKDIIINCPGRVYVKRSSQETSVQDIREYVENRLLSFFKNREYQLVRFQVKGLEPYPQGKRNFFCDTEDMVDQNGKLSLFVDIVIDGKKIDRVNVSGLVALYETVLLAKSSYKKGEILSKEKVYAEKKNIFEISHDYIKSLEAIEGKQLVSQIRKGECITVKLTASLPLIQKGDIVSLFAGNASLLIVTTGVCQEDGYENDIIKVENLNSGKIIRGIVKEKSKVEVIY